MNENQLWNQCAAFHGHICGGLAIGYQAATYAAKLLNLKSSKDEEVVCITENDACGVDAIQIVLGCTVGKGNLLFRLRGKQAFSFYNRNSGDSVRLVLKPFKKSGTKEEVAEQILNSDPAELFEQTKVKVEVPEHARIFTSIECENCHENTAESMIYLEQGKRLCKDCYHPYERFGL